MHLSLLSVTHNSDSLATVTPIWKFPKCKNSFYPRALVTSSYLSSPPPSISILDVLFHTNTPKQKVLKMLNPNQLFLYEKLI